MDRVQQFHEWLLKIKNIYLTDSERMERAFKIIENTTAEAK